MRTLLIGSLLLTSVLGCAGGGKVKVSGQVRYRGEHLPGGIVTFQTTDAKVGTVIALLDEQGNYEATLPVGEVQVAVDNRELQPRPIQSPPRLPQEVQQAVTKAKTSQKTPTPAIKAENPAAPTKPRGKYVPIPDRYYTIENSGLKFTVGPGKTKHDIELK